QLPDYIAESIPFFILTISLEFLTLALKDQGKGLKKIRAWNSSHYSVNDTIGSIGASMLQQVSKFFMYNISLYSYLYVYDHYRIMDLDPYQLSVWLACFLVVDLGYYWFHRAAHEVNLFWATHVVHHSSEYYNQTTALRQSLFQVYCSWLFDLPGALFFPPSLYLVHRQFNTLFQYWIHTQVIGHLGPLEYIINTPSAHHVHHGRNPYCIDKNYAGTLIIWDILFGTFEQERTHEPVAYGLTHPINTFDPLTIQCHHFIYLFKLCWTTPGFDKLKVLFYGPGWYRGVPRTGLIQDIPWVPQEMPPEKYDPKVSWSIQVYVTLHFMVLVFVNGLFLSSQEHTFSAVCMVSFYVLSTLTCFGWIFDSKPWAIQAEIVRCLIVCVFVQTQSIPHLFIFQLMSGLWLLSTQKKHVY
ncbi:hypothetical protein CU098_007391, partial [Rhizopus stolonifer]